MDTKSKGIFDNLINSVSNRDEKAALEAAKKLIADLEVKVAQAEKKATDNANRAIAAEKKVTELQAALTKAQNDSKTALAKVQADLQAARANLIGLEQRASSAEARVKAFEEAQLTAQQQAVAIAAEKAKILTTHSLTSEETLSHLSLKYYGHATEPYWRIIYEANKDVIGPNPNKVRPGLTLNIPVLPDTMKK